MICSEKSRSRRKLLLMLTGRNVYFLLFLQTDYKFENVSFIKKNKTKNNSCTKFLIWNKCTHYVNKLWNKYVPKGFQVNSQFHRRRKKNDALLLKAKLSISVISYMFSILLKVGGLKICPSTHPQRKLERKRCKQINSKSNFRFYDSFAMIY